MTLLTRWLLLPSTLAAGATFRREAAEAAARSRIAHRVAYPRADEPWTPAEDRRLLRLVTKLAPRGSERWSVIAKKLKRTQLAVQSRCYGLRAGLRLAKMGA